MPRETILAHEYALQDTRTLGEEKKECLEGRRVGVVRASFASEIQEAAFLRNALQGSSLVDNPERIRFATSGYAVKSVASAPSGDGSSDN